MSIPYILEDTVGERVCVCVVGVRVSGIDEVKGEYGTTLHVKIS